VSRRVKNVGAGRRHDVAADWCVWRWRQTRCDEASAATSCRSGGLKHVHGRRQCNEINHQQVPRRCQTGKITNCGKTNCRCQAITEHSAFSKWLRAAPTQTIKTAVDSYETLYMRMPPPYYIILIDRRFVMFLNRNDDMRVVVRVFNEYATILLLSRITKLDDIIQYIGQNLMHISSIFQNLLSLSCRHFDKLYVATTDR